MLPLTVALIILIPLLFVLYATGGGIGIVSPVLRYLNSLPILFSVSLILTAISAFIIYIRPLFGGRESSDMSKATVVAALMLIVIAYPIVVPPNSSNIVEEYVEVIDSPVNVTSISRITPLRTAYSYALSQLQLPTHTLYLRYSYLYYINITNYWLTPVYTWIIEPEGFFNRVTKQAKGVYVVYGDTYPPNVTTIDQELEWSMKKTRLLPVRTTLGYKIAYMKPHLKPIFDNTLVIPYNDDVYLLIPVKGWEKTLTGSVPVLAGYVIVDKDGDMEYIPANKLGKHELIAKLMEDGLKIPVLPEEIAREWISIYRWNQGFIAKTFYKQTYEIRNVGINAQPYLVYDDNGHLWWLFVAEPAGESYAVKHLIYVDAESVEPRILVYTPDETWMGASKIIEFVKSKHPEFNWDDFIIEEPLPIIDETLYWKVSIITIQARGMTSIDLVNALTGAVTTINVQDTLTMNQFLQYIGGLTEEGGEGDRASGVTVKERIQSIREQIRVLRSQLDELERELDELEKMLGGEEE